MTVAAHAPASRRTTSVIFGVGLVAHDAVHDVRARLLQAVDSSMFASSSKRARSSTITVTSLPACAAATAHRPAGVVTGAVQRLLDRQHLRIGRAWRRKSITGAKL